MMIKTRRIRSLTDQCIPVSGYHVANVLSWHPHDTPYYELSPYYLRTDGNEELQNNGGVLFENFWQGSKVYPFVEATKQYSHYSHAGDDRFLWWSYPSVTMIKNDVVQPDYFRWRNALYNNNRPIRYPVGREARQTCLFSLVGDRRLGYIQARKEIYCKEYQRLVRKLNVYTELLHMLQMGRKLCVYEIDVPDWSKHGLFHDVNPDGTYDCSIQKLNALMNDPSEAFGHGLCLISALLTDLQTV